MPTLKPKPNKTPEQALQSLMNLCARAEKSSGDALRLMRNWGVESTGAQEVLQRLLSERFIDDRRYASAFVREKLNLSGWGAYKIRMTLKTKGVSREIIEEVLAEYDSETINNRLEQYLRKRLSRLSGTPYEMKVKLIRYGASLGYDYDTVISTATKVTQCSDE